jgi:hypothetical protein
VTQTHGVAADGAAVRRAFLDEPRRVQRDARERDKSEIVVVNI